MQRKDVFYLITVLTVVAIRTEVFLFPARQLVVYGVLVHHFWIGVALILLAVVLSKKYSTAVTVLSSIGLGLVADELIFMLLGGGTVHDYWSIYSVWGVIVVMVIIFIFRRSTINKIV